MKRGMAITPAELRRLTELYGPQATVDAVIRVERPDLSLPLSLPDSDRRAILDAYVQMAAADARFEDALLSGRLAEADDFSAQFELASNRLEEIVSEIEAEDLEGDDADVAFFPLPLDEVLSQMHATYLRALEGDVGLDYGPEPSRTHAKIIREEMRTRPTFDDSTTDRELIDAAEEAYADRLQRRQRNPGVCDAANARYLQYQHLIRLADGAEVTEDGRLEAQSFAFWAMVRLSQAIDLAEQCPATPHWYPEAQQRLELLQGVLEVLWMR